MPATSPEAKARKAKRHAERRKERGWSREARRKAQFAADPAAAEAFKAHARERDRIKREEKRNARPFVGCDGEGAKDENGRSRYVLFRMGSRELFHADASRLTTPELLQFIVNHPSADDILVGFFFEYDISNILRDVSSTRDPAKPKIPSRLERVLQVDLKAAAGEPNPYAFGGWTSLKFEGFPEFGVQYIPRNFLKVCRLEHFYDRRKGRWTHRAAKGSTRAIYDTQGFFQCPFLKALELWAIGVEHHAMIAEMKKDRSEFVGLTPEVRDYNRIECDLLAEVMEAFRVQCIACGMVPATWNGAGKIASALLKAHDAMTAKRLAEITPPAVIELAHAAYYGGRFETTVVGRLDATWEHDIGSAYPAEMVKLPCLEHGRWIECSGDELKNLDALFVARVRYWHPPSQFLCGLPHRSKKGRLSWPREGNGVYWSPEIRSAERLGAKITFKGGWRFEPACDCEPYGFINELYELRRAIGKSVRGVPIKLGLNSLYGKKAQRIGKPTYANPIEAGLITAGVRAKINDAIVAAKDQRRIRMIATDALYSKDGPIEGLDMGAGLGQWEVKAFPSLFIVRPGLYWPPDRSGNATDARKLKTRGLSPKFFEPLIPTFEAAWDRWIADPDPATVPVVPVPIETFVGVRLAMRQNNPDQSCQWIERKVECKFSWIDKRKGIRREGEALMLGALPGDAQAHSHHYDASAVMASSTLFDMDRMIFEAMPDYLDFSAPYADEALPPDED